MFYHNNWHQSASTVVRIFRGQREKKSKKRELFFYHCHTSKKHSLQLELVENADTKEGTGPEGASVTAGLTAIALPTICGKTFPNAVRFFLKFGVGNKADNNTWLNSEERTYKGNTRRRTARAERHGTDAPRAFGGVRGLGRRANRGLCPPLVLGENAPVGFFLRGRASAFVNGVKKKKKKLQSKYS